MFASFSNTDLLTSCRDRWCDMTSLPGGQWCWHGSAQGGWVTGIHVVAASSAMLIRVELPPPSATEADAVL